ncbi:C6 transcription factor domain protein [Aspergillus niger ATCC 13496]|uniref:C6 transcription factor domain protein n=1 Tax=Aspergillus niger ATCC 13496 TaxID=1353008 RepID=A0A370CDU2_ASPNG|nr:C6 transcription factor domain protein [Aspergillus niger CBS 513.88]RDH24183.1 C6 transcription factor domain protein [Aspergillus niger ATCC 13496]|eukprot:XP_001396213.2 C6 transcription factor domain protein [Aspergillus niger CBS 513.88]
MPPKRRLRKNTAAIAIQESGYIGSPSMEDTRNLVPLASAPAKHLPLDAHNGSCETGSLTPVRFNCQACVRKKIKCNRAVPKCANCIKTKLECVYQPPPPRRKRKRSQGEEDVHERLAPTPSVISGRDLEASANSIQGQTPGTANSQADVAANKLLPKYGNSRHIDDVLLLDAGEGDLGELSVSESEQQNHHEDEPGPDKATPTGLLGALAAHSISDASTRSAISLTDLHPSCEHAAKLWYAYVENVEPLCKVLHVPTVARIVHTVSKHPATASKNDECILFAIYHFAVFSMSDDECSHELHDSRAQLMHKYRTAVTQALVNASWLKTTSLPVLQAYTLFLISLRTQIDSHTFWILTGIAIRLAQRIGLHRDGESVGLPHLRSRCAGGSFGSCYPWTATQVKHPARMFPGMNEPPHEKRGASEMIFCLARMELSNFYTRTGVQLKGNGGTIEFRTPEEIERLIDEVEDLIEKKFLRYCDILNPLHFLTTGVMRSAISAVRLRARMPLLKQETITDTQQRHFCTLAEKVLDTRNVMYSNPATQKFRWQMQALFVWDSLLCILRSIAKVGFYSPSELDAAWKRVSEVYANHEALRQGRRTLYATIAKITLKAWLLNPPRNSTPEPDFMTALRAQHKPKEIDQRHDSTFAAHQATDGAFYFDELFDDMSRADPNMNNAFNLDPSADWLFWDQMCGETSLG